MSETSTTLPDPVSSLEAELSAEFENLPIARRLERLGEVYGDRLVASTSFGLQAAVSLHLMKTHLPEVPVVFVDTGYHFAETYQYAEQLQEFLDLKITVLNPAISAARQEALYGKLWEQGKEGAEKYALLNKVEPMNRALKTLGADAWISGLRRSQSSTRQARTYLERQKATTKIYPILDWADAQVAAYFHRHKLPAHPLASQGYVTMGDWHSTRRADEVENAEQTRFNGEKYECGLHEVSTNADFQI